MYAGKIFLKKGLTSTRFLFKEYLFHLALFVTLPQIVPKQNTAATRARNIPRKLRRWGEAFSVEYRSCTLLVIEWGGERERKCYSMSDCTERIKRGKEDLLQRKPGKAP